MRKTVVPAVEEFERELPAAAIIDEFLTTGRRYLEFSAGQYENDLPSRAPTSPFRMSSATCSRESLFNHMEVARCPEQGQSLRRFAIGNAVEAILESAFRWKGLLLERQFKLWRDWAIRAGRGHQYEQDRRVGKPDRLVLDEVLVVGHGDGIVMWSPEWAAIRGPIPPAAMQGARARVMLVDWKSVNSDKFDYLDNEPDEGYFMQQARYYTTYLEQRGDWLRGRLAELGVGLMEFREFEGATFPGSGDPLIHQVRLLYQEKNEGRIKQVGIPMASWAEKAIRSFYQQRADSENYRMVGQLPAELPGQAKPHWKCNPNYCRFAVARDQKGAFRCPTVGAYWDGQNQKRPDLRLTKQLEAGSSLYGPPVQPEAAAVQVEHDEDVEAPEIESTQPAMAGKEA